VAADLARRLRRSGLSFVEVVVTLAVVATLGAVVFSSLSSQSDRQRALQTVAMMDALRLSIFRFDSAVGRFPGRLRHLHTPITGIDPTICSALAYTTGGKGGGQVGAWASDPRGGPFYEYSTSAMGFATPIGQVSDTLVRNPTAAANVDRSFGVLQIVVRKVSTEDAEELNSIVDADGSAVNGAVQWTADGSGTNTMTWNIPIGGC
jgi:type II secretory pathway pseudopilin PulG